MLEKIKDKFDILVDKFYAVSTRERILLTLVFVAVLYGLWSALVYDNLASSQKHLRQEQISIRANINTLKQESVMLTEKIDKNPVKILDQRVVLLERENKKLAEQIAKIANKLVPPKIMTEVLTTILNTSTGIEVIKVENVKENPLFETTDENAPDVKIYKHGMSLEFRANYFDTVAFLELIEGLKWKMLWDTLSYEVEAYPYARVKLMLYTLSLDRGWIGA